MPKKTEFVTITGVPVRVDAWGGVSPSDIEKNPEAKPKDLILLVPGNPGVVSFYDSFLERLHEKTKKCVWIVSHGGHDKGAENLPPLDGNEDLFNLRGQTEQKKRFMEKYLENVNVICIGHSIGCKMLLEVLKNSDVKIKQGYFLFPTIERMAESKNAKIFTFAHSYLLWLILIGCCIFVNLPQFITTILLKCYIYFTSIAPENAKALLDFIDPDVMKRVFFLADDELKKVRHLDDSDISKLKKHVKLYYGTTDGWVPLNYCKELKQRDGDIDAEICTKGFEHAFVLKNSLQMADLLSEWIIAL
ncbi:UNVERIFIED_CONTAM: hypothetical protein PYX00_000571 [Menopon gallinae]|uniref:Lipid droplet-associated hydrolase n=1 Tax=Menopon gallinae TaxID=328185 RepID=A0AAW2IBQ1_9NEOP